MNDPRDIPEICMCGDRRIDHRISDSSCKKCKCKAFELDEVLYEVYKGRRQNEAETK